MKQNGNFFFFPWVMSHFQFTKVFFIISAFAWSMLTNCQRAMITSWLQLFNSTFISFAQFILFKNNISLQSDTSTVVHYALLSDSNLLVIQKFASNSDLLQEVSLFKSRGCNDLILHIILICKASIVYVTMFYWTVIMLNCFNAVIKNLSIALPTVTFQVWARRNGKQRITCQHFLSPWWQTKGKDCTYYTACSL